MPGDDLVRRVDDGDERPRDLLVGEPVGLEQAAVGRLGEAPLHAIAASSMTLPSLLGRGRPRGCRTSGVSGAKTASTRGDSAASLRDGEPQLATGARAAAYACVHSCGR